MRTPQSHSKDAKQLIIFQNIIFFLEFCKTGPLCDCGCDLQRSKSHFSATIRNAFGVSPIKMQGGKKKKILDGTPTFCFHSCHIVSRRRALVIMQNGSYMKETPLSDLESIKPKCDVSCAGAGTRRWRVGVGGALRAALRLKRM